MIYGAIARRLGLAAITLFVLSGPVWSQAIPADAAVAIAAALRDDQLARANLAITSSVFHDAANPLALDNARGRATAAALSSAVVASIAAHPAYAQAIVKMAVAAAPDYGTVIIERASMAFPGFAHLFGGAAPTVAAQQYAAPAYMVSQPLPLVHPMATATPDAAGTRDPFILDMSYLETYPANAVRVVAAPFWFDSQDWINTAVVAGIGGGLMLLDNEIRDFMQGDVRTSTTDDLADVVYHFGSFYTLAAGLGVTYAGGELIGDHRLQEVGLLGGQSLLIAGVLGIGAKWVFQRDRPNSGKGAGSWSPFSFDEDNTAFPSGHALHAFAVAAVVASEYEDYELVGPIAYGLASATSLSRLNDNKHWASDVFVGGALGYFIGKMVVRYNPFDLPPGIAVGPWRQDDGQGLSLGFDF